MGLMAMVTQLVMPPTIVTASTVGNWNSGVGTSGQPGADLFTLGHAGQWWKLTEAYLLLAAFNAAATVTVRAYETLIGAEREVLNDDWVVAVDGEIAYIFWFWDLHMFGPVRVEVYSDQAADDGLAAPYEYRFKVW